LSARLSQASLASARPDVIGPAYDRAATLIGWVHFGPGAFHRAHQAFYADRMLARDRSLAIEAVSLRSDDLRAALAPQDGLYSLLEREAEPRLRIIGAIRKVLTAPRDPEALSARLTSRDLKVISATVTEKGYCLTPDGELDLAHPDIVHDLADPPCPTTLVGWLANGLARRHAAGLGAPVVLSCDNLSGNGGKLSRATARFARAQGRDELARWIAGEVRFPDSMVDSITPASDATLRADVERGLGLFDAWPVQREGFTQWVIGEGLEGLAGTFCDAGVTLTSDVAAFETAKLRLLNGAHSTLAYVGLGLGHATVAQAMADARLADFIEGLMRRDIAASLGRPAGFDAARYIDDILARFRNPAISHQLGQIAWDGSQKLPIRLLATIAEARAAGRPVERLAIGVAGWMAFVRRQAQAGAAIIDPLAERLTRIGAACDGEPARDVARFMDLTEVFSRELKTDLALQNALVTAYGRLTGPDPYQALV
jgi:fructuronate reductase